MGASLWLFLLAGKTSVLSASTRFDLACRLVYTLVQNHIRQLEDMSPEVDRMAAEALEEYDEEAPLLRSSEADDQA